MRYSNLFMLVAAALLLSAPAHADVPDLVNFQSVLRDSLGVPVPDAAYLVKFIIYDEPVPSGGGERWNSGFQTINTKNGLFEYHLGANTPLPDDLFARSDTALFLGITVGVDPEMTPRIKLTSVAYSQRALRSDSSAEAASLGGQPPLYYRDWQNITSKPAGFADDIDDDTHVGASAPLQINVDRVEVIPDGIDASHIAAAAVGTSEIDDGSIVDADISGSAAIQVGKIAGTAMNLSSYQVLTGDKKFGDSSMRVNNNGVRIGDPSPPVASRLVHMERQYNTPGLQYGHYIDLDNSSTGTISGIQAYVGATDDAGGARYGIWGSTDNNDASTADQWAVRGVAGSTGKTAGAAYGVYGSASGGVGSTSYGVYGNAFGDGTVHAGYFSGDVNVTGTLTKGGGAFKIDHPLDPANRYLQHSFVESPDMKNVYDGTIELDGMGRAMVELPDYFEALNQEFRYQLTAIGSSQPGLYIEQEVVGNRFVIAGGAPLGRVSWQVTGVRKDPFARANRIEVEVEKSGDERGKYVHYEEYGVGLTQAVDGEELQQLLDEESEGQTAEE